jgi:hypothetical protein
MNVNVRPIFMNNKIFFCAKRGLHTAVMQYFITGNGRITDAIDVSSHIETYIPADVTQLSGSPINNMLFLTAQSTKDTIYVYKYFDSGDTRIQSAWFKWTYDGEIYSATSLGKNLNISIKRQNKDVGGEWVLGTGIWQGDSIWHGYGIWQGNPDSVGYKNNVEVQPIHSQEYTEYFKDASEFKDNTNIVTGLESKSFASDIVRVGLDIFTTEEITVTALTDSTDYGITVLTKDGRIILASSSSAVVPVQSGDSIVEIKYTENEQINNGVIGVQFFGFDVTSPSSSGINLLYNGDFSQGLSEWQYANWTEIYKAEDIGYNINTLVSLGEWVLASGDKKINQGKLMMKTCQVSSEDDSDFYLLIENVERGSSRFVESRFTQNRRPAIQGKSEDIRLHIPNNSTKGFRINSVVLEGKLATRSRRI